jgi:hypothetical protein
MQSRLRTPDQGADTIVWAAASRGIDKVENGAFLFDRRVAREHLWMAGTQTEPGEVERLVVALKEYLSHPQ